MIKKMTVQEFNNAFNLALAGIGNDFVNELVKTAPVDTGFLKNATRYEVVGHKLNIHMPEYAFCIEFGTQPHIIRAVNAKALHWKKDGKDHYAQVVHHPGTEPYPFIRHAINYKLRDIVYNNLKKQLT